MGLSYHSCRYYHYYFCNDQYHIMLSSLSFCMIDWHCLIFLTVNAQKQLLQTLNNNNKQNKIFKLCGYFFSPQAGLPPPLQTSHDVSLSSPDCKFTNVDNYSYKIL